ncbi:RNA polymerase sigma factor [Paenibacillus senegalensis]|uniref:RNA polymerase sigma factor n=1 Tax=Paenibacillus senegalensis TaxID=1465766 RepID=UPI000289340B|nr:RNA polymerase sigma factor [Paenibacillus senegalensis]
MSKHLILLYTDDFYSLSEPLQKEVYREFYSLVYPLVYVIVKDHGACEDIIQDAFLRAVTKIHQIEQVEKLESWLKTLAKNVALSFLKKWKRQRDELGSEDVFINSTASWGGYGLPTEQEVEGKLMKEAITSYMNQLKPEYRNILEMRWLHNFSYKEMAEILNTSEGSVRQKLFRAREAIKRRLMEEWGVRDE